jgi:hypothetical protein
MCGQFEHLYNLRNTHIIEQFSLNGKLEHFTIDPNFINCSGRRKLFKREEDDIPVLYWYKTFGAVVTVKGPHLFVTPCGLAGTDYILVSILETRCFNPVYEALVCNQKTNECFIWKQTSKWMTTYECDLNMKFDDAIIRRFF